MSEALLDLCQRVTPATAEDFIDKTMPTRVRPQKFSPEVYSVVGIDPDSLEDYAENHHYSEEF